MEVGGGHIDPLAAASMGVDLKLLLIAELAFFVLGHLVVNDGQISIFSALAIKDDVGSSRKGAIWRMQLERSFDSPNPEQVLLMFLDILLYQPTRRAVHSLESRLIRKRQVELLADEIPTQFLGRRGPRLQCRFGQMSQNVVECAAVTEFFGDALLESVDGSQPVTIAALLPEGGVRKADGNRQVFRSLCRFGEWHQRQRR